MLTIYKYKVGTSSILEMPKGAKILRAKEQKGSFYIWAIVDTEAELENRIFHVAGTGWPVEADWKYIDTIHPHVELVFHIFEGVIT